MNPLFEALVGTLCWYAVSLFLAAVLYPGFRRFFPASLAWGTTRILTPTLLAWTTLLPSIVRVTAVFSRTSLAISFLGLAGISFYVYWAKEKNSPWQWSKKDRTEIIYYELVFALAALAGAFFIPELSTIHGLGERMRDSAIWMGIFGQRIYPQQDPWLAGQALRYYTLGYYSLATTGFFLPQSPAVSFHLALNLTFANYLASLYLVFRVVPLRPRLAALGATAIALGSNFQSLRAVFGAAITWWDVSRVIKNTITEFPLWTFLLGDLHPHFIALPYLGLLLAGIIVAAREKPSTIGWAPALFGILTGIVWAANTWEMPVFLTLSFAALLYVIPNRRNEKLILGLTTLCFALVIEMPFFRYRNLMPMRVGWVHVRSGLFEYLNVFALFLLPGFLSVCASFYRTRNWIGFAAFGTMTAVAIGLDCTWVFLLGLLVGFEWEIWRIKKFNFAAWLYTAGIGLCLGCEFVHLEDVYGEGLERMNTVFKMYMPAWTLLGTGSYLIVKDFFGPSSRWYFKTAGLLWMAALMGFVIFGIKDRFRDTKPSSLDGLAQLELDSFSDAQIIRRMRDEVAAGNLRGVILEAVGNGYSTYSRIASTTGLAGYLGWVGVGFTRLQYWELGDRLVAERRLAAETVYRGALQNCPALKSYLSERNISYVMVGQLENDHYPKMGLDSLRRCLTTVDRVGPSVLLSVR